MIAPPRTVPQKGMKNDRHYQREERKAQKQKEKGREKRQLQEQSQEGRRSTALTPRRVRSKDRGN
jgi:hypothetical protein